MDGLSVVYVVEKIVLSAAAVCSVGWVGGSVSLVDYGNHGKRG